MCVSVSLFHFATVQRHTHPRRELNDVTSRVTTPSPDQFTASHGMPVHRATRGGRTRGGRAREEESEQRFARVTRPAGDQDLATSLVPPAEDVEPAVRLLSTLGSPCWLVGSKRCLS